MGESPFQKYERIDRLKAKRQKAAWDLLKLVLLISAGIAIGVAVAHQVVLSAPAMKMLNETAHTKMQLLPVITWSPIQQVSLYGLLSYIGAATVVGVGLLNRMLRNSMFVVPIGSPLGILVAILFSSLIGALCLPGVIAWRVRPLVKKTKY